MKGLSKLGRLGLGRPVSGLGEFGSKWNKVKSAEIGSQLDLGQDKSALGMTWFGTNRFRKDLGRNKSALVRIWVRINLVRLDRLKLTFENNLGSKKIGIRWILFSSSCLSGGLGLSKVKTKF